MFLSLFPEEKVNFLTRLQENLNSGSLCSYPIAHIKHLIRLGFDINTMKKTTSPPQYEENNKKIFALLLEYSKNPELHDTIEEVTLELNDEEKC